MIPGLWRRMLWWLLAAGGRTRFRSGYSRRRDRVMLSMTRLWAAGRSARRSDGKLPPHVMVYFAMAMALFADDDYEEVAARLARTLSSWNCWDARGARRRRAGSPGRASGWALSRCRDIFARVAVPVADQLTRGAFLGAWRLMSIDGFERDAPDTPGNAAAFGYPPVPGRTARRSRRSGS